MLNACGYCCYAYRSLYQLRLGLLGHVHARHLEYARVYLADLDEERLDNL